MLWQTTADSLNFGFSGKWSFPHNKNPRMEGNAAGSPGFSRMGDSETISEKTWAPIKMSVLLGCSNDRSASGNWRMWDSCPGCAFDFHCQNWMITIEILK